MGRYRKAIIACLGGLTVAGLVLLFFYPSQQGATSSQTLTKEAVLGVTQFHVHAVLDSNTIEDGADDLLTVRVENRSGAASPGAPELRVDAPGFALDDNPGQLTEDGKQAFLCKNEHGKAVNSLAPGQSCQFIVRLRPACRSGVYGVSAFVTVGAPSQAALTLGPVTFDRLLSAAQFARMGRRLDDVAKGLALPIMLAILGAIFAAIQSDREARQKHEEDERQKKQKDADSELAERQEVNRLLLTRILDLAQNHYLPLMTQAKLILNEAAKMDAAKRSTLDDKDFEELFYHLLLLLKHMEVFRLTVGGVFFKRRDGELAMSAAWFLLKMSAWRGLGGDEVVARALKFVKQDLDYATYKNIELKSPPIHEAWTKFHAWRKNPLPAKKTGAEELTGAESFWEILGVVDAFQAIASFEADFALQYWYETTRDPKKIFQIPEETRLYFRKEFDPKGLAQALALQLSKLYERKVDVYPVI